MWDFPSLYLSVKIKGDMDLEKLNEYYFETGPIRPPSEAYSLLIRATRNCPWNRCSFCHTYRGQKFELRPAEDVIRDIETARAIVEGINEFGRQKGLGNQPREAAAYTQPGQQ
jgi:radical SAM superfamily enzyme YgiQ (UPF0313 family)